MGLANGENLRVCCRATGTACPLLIITSGKHRVDTHVVAEKLNVERLQRADAEYIKEKSGFSIGGVPLMVSATYNIAA
ncbi:MAG TPA: YbaK/EbsC family protein [archaeon]|nr:YbaK/EbsC family protein [archaeon]